MSLGSGSASNNGVGGPNRGNTRLVSRGPGRLHIPVTWRQQIRPDNSCVKYHRFSPIAWSSIQVPALKGPPGMLGRENI